MSNEMDKDNIPQDNQALIELKRQLEETNRTSERSRLALLSILEDEKETKQRLLESEQRYRTLVETQQDMITRWLPDTTITYVNRAYCEFLGKSREELIGISWLQSTPEDTREQLREFYRKLAQNPAINQYESSFKAADGSVHWVSWSEVPVLDASGHLLEFQSVGRDITERKKSEQLLEEREQDYRTLTQNMPGLVYRVHLKDNNRMQFFNDMVREITGYKESELLKGEVCSIDRLIAREDRDRVITVVKESLKNKMPFEIEYGLWHKDGKIRHLVERGQPVYGQDNEPLYIDGIIIDVSSRKQAERIQQVLYKISDAAIGCRDLQQLYIQIHKTVAGLMPAENLYIAIYDEKSDSISFPYYRDKKNDYAAPRKFGSGLTEHIIKTKKPLLVNKQVHDQLQREGKAEFVGQPSKQWLGVPLQSDHKTFGALVVQSYEDRTEYTQKDLELLNFIAGNVAVAINSIRAEQELAESETRYKTFMDSATDIAFLKDERLRYLMVNKAQQEFFGLPADQIIGKTDYDLMPNETAQACQLSDQMVLESRQTILNHEQIKDRIYETRKFPVILGNNRTGVGAYIRDITEKQRADQAIRDSQEKYRDLVENINDVVFAVDIYGKLVYISPSSEPVLGYRPDEIIGRKLIEFVKEDDRIQLARELQKSLEKGVAASEYRITTKDGVVRWISSSIRLMMDNGKPVGLNGLMKDITEHKLAEETIKNSETRYRRLFESAKDGILILNAETGIIEDANPFIKELLGYPREELIGKELWEIGLFKDIVASRDSFTELQKNDYVRYEDLPLQTKDGRKKEVEFVSNVYPVGNRNVVQCNIRDITQRVQAESQIKLAAKKWETTFDSIGDGVCLLDRQWKVLQCNQAFSKMVNRSYVEILGRTCFELVHGLKKPQEHCPVVRMEKSLHRETLELDHEGRSLLVTADPIFDESKNLIGAVHIVSDISSRKQMEQELLQAQKMEAVGFLAGGVAHDFNNMLAGIVGNAELLQLKVYGQKELEIYVDNIIKASGHAAGLTKQLLAFARKGQYQQVPVNVHKVIAETLGILGNTIDRRIKIEQHLRANPSVVLGDHSQLENAFMNLGINARDAMPDGGKLIFSTDLVNLDKEYILQHNYRIEPGPYIQISVEDSGSGMSDEVKRHLFEPFFTTKEKGRGTGLGLAGVYGCVKNHGGSIEVYSEPGRGTAIKLYLPLYGDLDAAGKKDFIEPQQLSATAGTGSILVVDDEDMIRSIAAQILKTAGYTVQTCSDGQEAVDLYAKEHGNIDLVIMDMVMPKVDGREAFKRMQTINPMVKVLLSSGFSEDGDAQAILQDGAQGFIQKPYRSAELLLRVQQALQGKDSG